MTNSEKKAEQFIKSINAQAEIKYNQIKKETDDYISAELKKARAAAKQNAKNAAKIEMSQRSEQSNTDSYKSRTQLVMQIIEKRNGITNSVFDEAQKKIADFTKDEKYLQFLIQSAKNIVSAIGADTVILIRPEDEKYKSELKALCKDVELDQSIILGGCKGVNSVAAMRADDTLDSRLNEQRQLFYEQSGLNII